MSSKSTGGDPKGKTQGLSMHLGVAPAPHRQQQGNGSQHSSVLGKHSRDAGLGDSEAKRWVVPPVPARPSFPFSPSLIFLSTPPRLPSSSSLLPSAHFFPPPFLSSSSRSSFSPFPFPMLPWAPRLASVAMLLDTTFPPQASPGGPLKPQATPQDGEVGGTADPGAAAALQLGPRGPASQDSGAGRRGGTAGGCGGAWGLK